MKTKLLTALLFVAGCFAQPPTYLGLTAPGDGPVVSFDVFHRPFAEIPLPNDFATRFDPSSPTKRRLNASVEVGPTRWERATRAELDRLSGWGTLAPITVSFSEDLDQAVILARHGNDLFDTKDDAVLVLDVTPGSPGLCEAVPLDLGQGNYPQVLAEQDEYDSDPRASLQTLTVEETEEDVNANGLLDPGEDTDMDGALDHPNTLDGTVNSPRLEFYERESHTLIMKPVMPMRDATTYAVVLTKRLTSPAGESVRSPFVAIHQATQAPALVPLPDCLVRHGLTIDDVAFTWTFTTQDIRDDYRRVRDGLYGIGPLAQIGADFPARVSRLDVLADPRSAAPKLVPMSDFVPLALQLLQLAGSSKEAQDVFEATMENVDFVVAGAIPSPQFFPRQDSQGAMLPLYRQVWSLDAPPRSEDVTFWLFVPKHRAGPAPVAIYVHGHGSSKFEALPFAGGLASYGIATLGIDGPGHATSVSDLQRQLLSAFFEDAGLVGLGESIFMGRAFDWTGDGKVDSGDDFWTSYVFHTRDNVRQTAVDVMQVVRTLRGFDGVARWGFDGHGLAGDFDGDGIVDVGGAAPLHLLGGSLGGITGAVIAGVEPQLDTTVSIVSGGMLSEIGTRSTLGGVKNAMVLRALGPIFYADQGALMVRVNLGQTDEVSLKVHDLPTLTPLDTVVLRNERSGEYRCGAVQPSGTFRVAVSCDAGDPLYLRVFRGPLAPRTPEGCMIPTEIPIVAIDMFGHEARLGATTFAAGSPLVAPGDGFGLRRATPDLRRFLGLSQVALDAADPMNWAPSWNGTRPMTYGTGETTRTQVMVMPSAGDPGVMIAAGVALARAAGFAEFDRIDPRYGKSQNQVALDTHTIEGTVRLARYRNSAGSPVLMDVEHLASVVPVDDGLDVPRLDPPLRLMRQAADGTWSGLIVPMLSPEGKHGFSPPDPTAKFDQGTYVLNQVARFMQSGGREFSWDKCQATSTCPWPTFPLK
ncbi:MAG: hypothetical protein HY791_36505 [Deltaproteobacteria bacterium]|nr:hypothetical protein [Deltaproteobacteria bacterium]